MLISFIHVETLLTKDISVEPVQSPNPMGKGNTYIQFKISRHR